MLWILLIICLVTIVIQYVLLDELTWSIVGVQAKYNLYYGLPLTLVNGWFFDYLNRKIPWDERPKQRAFAGVVGSIAVTMLTLFILNFILMVFFDAGAGRSLWDRDNRRFYIIALIITGIVSMTMHAITFFQEGQNEKRISAKLRQEKLAMELSALRAHIDPHFLFNSFNVLSGLIDEDREKAQNFLSELSKIYRYILEQRHEDTSTVADELKFAERYLSLQRMRFEDSINFQSTISAGSMNKRIPSLSLQLLLENAIKHNGFDAEAPLDISILERNDNLLVRNTKRARSNLVIGNGMGLQNIRDRYALLTKKEIAVEEEETAFTVKLPLI